MANYPQDDIRNKITASFKAWCPSCKKELVKCRCRKDTGVGSSGENSKDSASSDSNQSKNSVSLDSSPDVTPTLTFSSAKASTRTFLIEELEQLERLFDKIIQALEKFIKDSPQRTLKKSL